MNSNKIIFIVGPSAVGKSEIGFRLAQKLNGEIISCDAMQVYREVQIASDKPSRKTLETVPHHLVDIVSVSEDFDVARFRTLAVKAIEDIHGRGKLPVIVGGSGMYMSILLDGIFEDASGEKKSFEVKSAASTEDIGILFKRLKKVDPVTAQKISPSDRRRILRALEVFDTHGRPISELQKKRSGLWGKYPIKIFALNRPRAEIYRRVEARIDQMFENGLADEVRGLLGVKLSKTASVVIGVPEVKGFLTGEYDLERAKYLMELHTRHYVKRQLTWFRRDSRLTWIVIEDNRNMDEIVKELTEKMENQK